MHPPWVGYPIAFVLFQMCKTRNNQVLTFFKTFFLGWLALFPFTKSLHAQSHPVFVKINDAKALPSSSITSITQDKDGFIWIGTKNGLSRYDGNTHKIYNQTAGGLGADDVSKVFVDSRGRIWAGTSNGLQLLNKKEDRFIPFKSLPGINKSISSNEVNTIFEDSARRIWIGTENGLNLFVDKDSTFLRYQANAADPTSLSHNSVKSIFEGSDGYLWIGTFGGGLNGFDSKRRQFRHYQVSRYQGNSRAAHYINVIRSFSRDELLLGTSGEGLLIFNFRKGLLRSFFRKEKQFAEIPVIRAIYEEPGGTIWIGTDGNGLLKIQNAKTEKPAVAQIVKNNSIPGSLSSNAIYTIFSDLAGNVWLGTAWNGINILKRKDAAVQFYYSDFAGANPSPVLSIYKDQGNLWLGTDGFGLNILNTASLEARRLPRQKVGGDYVQLIKERRSGDFFIGTFSDGLIVYNLKAGKLHHYKHQANDPFSLSYNDVRDVTEEENGNFWVATWGGGLSYFDKAANKFTNFRKQVHKAASLSSDNVTALSEEPNGKMWVGTFGGGVNLFDPKTRKFQPVKALKENKIALSTLNIISLLKDSHGFLWMGTWGQGLIRLDTKTYQVVRYNKLGGLNEKTITALIEDDDGNVWMSTKNGIFQHDYKTGHFKHYSQLNGSYHINAVYKADGRLYFGASEGAVSFDPKKVQDPEDEALIRFTGLKLFNKEVKVGDADRILDKNIREEECIELRHDHSLITFEFIALDFPFSYYEYAIKLENFDKAWREIGALHEATFTNLAPGNYTLKVKARMPGGKWSDHYKQIRVLVHKPYWKTWWAYLIYFAVSSFLLYLFYRYTIHLEMLKNNLNLEKLNREKDQELNKLKLQFFTDVSHEIRTPVTLIMGSINRITEDKEGRRKEEALLELKKNSSHLMQLVNELLDFRKIDAAGIKLKVSESDFVGFVHEIFLSFSSHAENLGVNYRFLSALDHLPLWFDKEQMEKVVYNLLSNAFKFTHAGGTVMVEVIGNEHNVVLVVADTGTGISENKLNKIFKRFYQSGNTTHIKEDGFGIGLSIVKSIVKLHAGKVFVESEPGKGSRFSVKLLRGESHFSPVQKSEETDAHENLNHYLVSSSGIKVDPEVTSAFAEATVLVVEDNADIRKYLLDLLKPLFHTLEAANGVEAYETAVAQTPDLIISDVMMPEKDGISLTRDLKKDVRTSHIPVILLTARTSFIYKKEGLETGADDFITKPFSETLLRTRILNLLKSRQQLREKFQLEVITEPKNLTVSTPDQVFLAGLASILDQNLDNEAVNAEFIAKQIGISHSVVYKKVKSLTGLSLVEFTRDFRLKRAAQLLKDYDLPVTDVCYKVGFSDRRYFSQMFKKKFGVSPSVYGKDLAVKPVPDEFGD
jgi:signal transduction histidine kinase/ligand-binding sensor domain-containing protein/CheY-like chemotaxis protein